jgi:hypothetical protein
MRMQSPASPAGLAPLSRTPSRLRLGLSLFVVLVGLLGSADTAASSERSWVGTWATAPIIENRDATTPDFNRATLRQVVRVSTGGSRVRLKLSNAFGRTSLILASAELALAADGSARSDATAFPLRFNAQPGADRSGGRCPHLRSHRPANARTRRCGHHPADRVRPRGDHRAPGRPRHLVVAPDRRVTSDGWGQAHRVDRWYFITGIDVETAVATPVDCLAGRLDHRWLWR